MDAVETHSDLPGRRVLLGVTGGIAVYKSPDLVRRLRERGAEVRVAMTAGAAAFVTPLTFQAVSGRAVHSELLDEQAEAGMGHIELARWADAILIAPATADLIARLAAGMADDLLTTVCLASEAPLFLAPAMNRVMWRHPATVRNVRELTARGAVLIGPEPGDQACGERGVGRMTEPADIATAVAAALRGPGDSFAGRRVLITAGPTHEDFDPVRFIGNRSSGKMGFALASAFAAAGAEVTVIAGPVHLPTPRGIRRLDVRSGEEMHRAVLAELDEQDVFVAAAAVADFRPATCVAEKIKKGTDQAMTLELTRNPDILADVAAREERPFTVGFAAETSDLIKNARTKLVEKGVDMIAANRVGGRECPFDAVDNALTVLWPGGSAELDRAPKQVLAQQLVALIGTRLGEGASHGS